MVLLESLSDNMDELSVAMSALVYPASTEEEEEEVCPTVGSLRSLLVGEHAWVLERLDEAYPGSRKRQDDVMDRFLRARESADQAVEMFVKDVRWRLDLGVAEIRELSPRQVLGCDPHIVKKFHERRLLGLDYEGRPVYLQNYGKFVVSELKKHTALEALERYHVFEQERAASLIDALEAKDGTMSVVLDLGGMTLAKHVDADFMRLVKRLAEIDQNSYPERMQNTYVVNAPRAFWLVWQIVRPWLDAQTVGKIKIFTVASSPRDWRSALAKDLGESVLAAVDDGANYDDCFEEVVPVDSLAVHLKKIQAEAASAAAECASRRQQQERQNTSFFDDVVSPADYSWFIHQIESTFGAVSDRQSQAEHRCEEIEQPKQNDEEKSFNPSHHLIFLAVLLVSTLKIVLSFTKVVADWLRLRYERRRGDDAEVELAVIPAGPLAQDLSS